MTGTQLPGPYVSTAGSVTLMFSSDDTVTESGALFTVSYGELTLAKITSVSYHKKEVITSPSFVSKI